MKQRQTPPAEITEEELEEILSELPAILKQLEAE